MSGFCDLTGRRFGRLIVVARKGTNASGKITWQTRCDCGAEPVVVGANLRAGNTTSCGCYRVEASRAQFTTHGGRNTRLYCVWLQMKNRCSNPKFPGYRYYGGRGIKVCQRWRDSFENFIADMGPCPTGYTIDRFPNGNGDYEPSNCRWASRSEQRRNQTRYKVAHNIK